MTDTNPMSEQLEQLHDQWTAFVRRADARLLVWQANADEARIVGAFVMQECDADSALTEDLFVQLATPFVVPSLHGISLASELLGDYEEAVSASEGGEQAKRWRPATRNDRESDQHFFVRLLSSLRQHEGQLRDGKLTVWLRPSATVDKSAYLGWLQGLVIAAPSELRFIVLDELERPALSPLLAAEPSRVVGQRCELRVTQALAELAQVGSESEPAVLFRALQTRLSALIEAGDLPSAEAAATTACELASERGWPLLGALVQMMLASGYVAQRDSLAALRAYGEADRLATETGQAEGASADSPTAKLGLQLRLQARLGQGATLLAARAFKQAAELYMKSTPLAKSLGDGRIELDCYRLASVCYAELGEGPMAWELGMRGFAHGAVLDEEMRGSSTFAYLAEHMLRMSESYPDYRAHRQPLAQQITRILGPDWRAQLSNT